MSVQITASVDGRYGKVLTPETLGLLADLHRRFEPRRVELLRERRRRQAEISAGGAYDFLAETAAVREGIWRVPGPPPGLVDRRVEITGPTDRKMTVNALNSGASVWMADFEDANTPTWHNQVQGQVNLIDALDRTIDFIADSGKAYALGETLPTIVVRPRGWHLPERHVLVDGEPVSGSLFDFAVYLANGGPRQLAAGLGPYYYLPKLETHREARLWHDVFVAAEDALGLDRGTIRATVLIETIGAAYEMDEILYELREHAAGLNAGRWDYLFSIIKKFHARGPEFILPDRNAVTMTAPFMRAYSELLVRTCHRRGAYAIGGMAAFVPSRRDPEVNATALAKVRADKTREAGDGYDGSWVAHPDLVPVCREVFDGVLGDRPNQLDNTREDVHVTAAQLVDLSGTGGRDAGGSGAGGPGAGATAAGLRNNIAVCLRYLAAWLRGSGAVAIFDLMEDAATAEIARAQIWQWLRQGVRLDTGATVTRELVEAIEAEEAPGEEYADARALFERVALGAEFVEFLTIPAYDLLLGSGA